MTKALLLTILILTMGLVTTSGTDSLHAQQPNPYKGLWEGYAGEWSHVSKLHRLRGGCASGQDATSLRWQTQSTLIENAGSRAPSALQGALRRRLALKVQILSPVRVRRADHAHDVA